MATFAAETTGVLWAGQWDTTSTANYMSGIGNFSECWLRVYGDSFKVNYRSAGTDPIWVNIDGAGWTTPTGGTFINTGSTKTLSGEIFPGGTSDDWHLVRLRIKAAFAGGGFKISLSDGFVVTSTGGVAAVEAHTDYGDYETIKGAFAASYWSENYSTKNWATMASYTAGTFPDVVPLNGTTGGRGGVVEFTVDSSTTKMYLFSINTTGANANASIWIDGVRQGPPQLLSDTTFGSAGLSGPYTISGSGQRVVRVTNLRALHSVLIDGSFVAETLPSESAICYVSGDSVTAGASYASQPDGSGQWIHLVAMLRRHIKFYNRGLSGDTATAWSAAASGVGRIADFDAAADLVVCNMSINDATRAASVPATVQAEYESYYNKLLAHCSSATIIAVEQLPYASTNRSAIKSVIQAAVTAINDPRLIYRTSDNWVSGGGDGIHPDDLRYAQSVGGRVASINVSGQPSDGNTVTINGTVFEFDSDASVTGGNVAVTIGATLVDTINNLSDAIANSATTADLFGEVITSGAATLQGVVVSNCTSLAKSGTNINVYGPEAAGWIDIFDEFLPASSGGSGVNLLLLGVG